MKYLGTFLVFIFTTTFCHAQLLEENFPYTAAANLTANGWTSYQNGGTNPVTVASAGLTYAGYASSGIGNAALMDNSGEGVYRTFAPQTSGTVYVSFLFQTTTAFGSQFIHVASDADPATGAGRVAIRSEFAGNGDYEFGISRSSTGNQGSTNVDAMFGTTYLLVIKYQIKAAASDELSLFVFSSGVPATEPASPDAGPFTGTDPANIGSVALAQANSNQNIIIDGLRVGTTWLDAPLPVELASLSAASSGDGVSLNWLTATETNNFGFEVQRKQLEDGWSKVGFVRGHGTTTSPRNYSFVDETASAGRYFYRLKQIDTDGSFEYSSEISVTVGVPSGFGLAQNFPNPFNPSTTIRYTLPAGGYVGLTVSDVLGNLVRQLVSTNQTAGEHTILWDGKDNRGRAVSSGIYFYSLQSPDKVSVSRRMLLMK